jgi:hypothetical protein
MHDAAARQFAPERPAGHLDEAVIRLLKPGQATQLRVLATAARTDQRDDVTLVHIEASSRPLGGNGRSIAEINEN